MFTKKVGNFPVLRKKGEIKGERETGTGRKGKNAFVFDNHQTLILAGCMQSTMATIWISLGKIPTTPAFSVFPNNNSIWNYFPSEVERGFAKNGECDSLMLSGIKDLSGFNLNWWFLDTEYESYLKVRLTFRKKFMTRQARLIKKHGLFVYISNLSDLIVFFTEFCRELVDRYIQLLDIRTYLMVSIREILVAHRFNNIREHPTFSKNDPINEIV